MAKTLRYRYPIVVVEWLDACEHADGDGLPRHQPQLEVSVGWLLLRDRTGVSIANEYGTADDSYRNEMFIPARMVKSVRRL